MDPPAEKKPPEREEEKQAEGFRQMLEEYIRDLRAIMDRLRRKLH